MRASRHVRGALLLLLLPAALVAQRLHAAAVGPKRAERTEPPALQEMPPVRSTARARTAAGVLGATVGYVAGAALSNDYAIFGVIAGSVAGAATPRGAGDCSFARRLIRGTPGALLAAPLTILALQKRPTTADEVILGVVAMPVSALAATIIIERAC